MANELPYKDPDIITRIVDFLKESSEYYSTSVKRKVDDERLFSGDFWTPELIKEWRRTKRRHEHLSQWGVFESAISSPITSSPWHAQLVSQDGNPDVQEAINAIEADSDAKDAFQNAFAKATDIGASYIVVTTVADEFTGEPKIVPEVIKDPAAVALDPCVVKASARDAECGAIVNWISLRKARRLYGQDVCPMDCPVVKPLLYDIGDQWIERPKNSIPIVTYYEKTEQGTVRMYKVCGDKVVEEAELPTSYIPIFRFAAYEVTKGRVVDYIGIVSKTYTLQLGLNLAYSTLLDRMNRSPKANFMYPAGAMDGLEDYLARCCEDDALALVFNPVEGAVPIQLKEAFETGDLQNIISVTQQLMAAVLGIPPTGLQGSQMDAQVVKTATEVLEQAANRESNVASLYSHAYEAMRAIWMCVIELITGGERIQFKLEAGPDVITANMKRRQELQAMSQFLPENLKPILAKYYADTLSTDDAKMLSKDIVANMDPNVKLVSNEELDAYAIHEIRQIKMVADQAMDELEKVKAENEELKQKLSGALQELGNKREQRVLDWNKALLDSQQKQNQLQLEIAKAEGAAAVDQGKLDLEAQRVAIEAQDRMEATISDTNQMMGV